VRGRLHQGGWNLFFFGVTAIGVALTLNIRNSKWGYWINLGILALAGARAEHRAGSGA
jgi:hypothetical protein